MAKLASLEDIGKFLSGHKVEASDANTSSWQIEAARIIKSMLSGTFTVLELHAWQTPETTPPIIRSIAGELCAAYLYRELYAEDETAIPEYAQQLYNEAIGMLQQIRDGLIVVLDDEDVPIADVTTTSMGPGDFWPNDTTDGPYFKMADVF